MRARNHINTMQFSTTCCNLSLLRCFCAVFARTANSLRNLCPGPASEFAEAPPASGGFYDGQTPGDRRRARYPFLDVLATLRPADVCFAIRCVRRLRLSQQLQGRPLRERLCGAVRLPADDLALAGFRLHDSGRRSEDHTEPVASRLADPATGRDRTRDRGRATPSAYPIQLRWNIRPGTFQDRDLRSRSGACLPALQKSDDFCAPGLCGDHP